MAKLLILHGPNLNMLGTRERHLYGHLSLPDINQSLTQDAAAAGHEVVILQSNHEGVLVDAIQQHGAQAAMLIMNPGAYTHTSVAIRDAILAVRIPVIEVHLSNVHQREPFRQHSYLADLAIGQVVGFGAQSYTLALQAACHWLQHAAPR